jgi:hypothetical protein
MKKALTISTVSFLAIALLATTAAAKRRSTEGEGDFVARADVEKKYAIVDRNLKPSAKFRLNYITAAVYDAARNGKDVDFYTLAKNEIIKSFAVATDEQKEVLAFYALVSALKKVEADVEEMRDERAETSTIFDNMNVKANELFDMISSIYVGLKGVSAKTVAKII